VQAAKGTLNHNGSYNSEDLVKYLSSFGIETIQQLETLALRERKTVYDFVLYWLDGQTFGKVDTGIGAFYLVYILAWRSHDRKRVLDYLAQAGLGRPEDREYAADRLLEFQPSEDLA
jgi:hypothetical protein